MEVRGADVLQFFKQMLSSYIIQYNRKYGSVPNGSLLKLPNYRTTNLWTS